MLKNDERFGHLANLLKCMSRFLPCDSLSGFPILSDAPTLSKRRGEQSAYPYGYSCALEPELSSAMTTARGLQVNLSSREVYVACSNNDSCPFNSGHVLLTQCYQDLKPLKAVKLLSCYMLQSSLWLQTVVRDFFRWPLIVFGWFSNAVWAMTT